MTTDSAILVLNQEIESLRSQLAAAALEREILGNRMSAYAELADASADVASYLKAKCSNATDGPLHTHSTPGHWDQSNHIDVAGKPCAWCATWARFKLAIEDSNANTDEHGAWGGFISASRDALQDREISATAECTDGRMPVASEAPNVTALAPMYLDDKWVLARALDECTNFDGNYIMSAQQVLKFASIVKGHVHTAFQPGFLELRQIISQADAITQKAVEGATSLELTVGYKQKSAQAFDTIADFARTITMLATILQPPGIVLAEPNRGFR